MVNVILLVAFVWSCLIIIYSNSIRIIELRQEWLNDGQKCLEKHMAPEPPIILIGRIRFRKLMTGSLLTMNILIYLGLYLLFSIVMSPLWLCLTSIVFLSLAEFFSFYVSYWLTNLLMEVWRKKQIQRFDNILAKQQKEQQLKGMS